ncbi:hypothetical protein LOTGIDRAFT_102306 [Lottia gigantea]|uniref:Major facilitator superfamily (MFS) profile domain-containing protein n=1 Tax=Lottia gigantea TaxID=225164 RepID=V4B4R6_LOTGI|nr:hypothetical protein LOTGIDRAFT_102306 [Lottia gigantea]ESP05478.1 hypothetical protein LOTGIDRAFT_102306 [Lottia gigantea]
MSSHLLLLVFLYFIQGLPYGLQSRFLPTYFRSNGMSLTKLGLFKLLLAPWMLKTLWAPLVDKYGSKKSWLVTSMVGLVVTCFFGAVSEPDNIIQLTSVLLLFNLLTSTQDIAVDGVAINLLTTVELGYGNIAQVVGYKFGAIFGGGLMTWLMEYISWVVLFQSLAMVYCLGVFIVLTFLPKTSEKENCDLKDDVVTNQNSWWKRHISDVFNTEGTYWILVYVLIYKLGEQGALSMTPLFLLDNGVSTTKVGFWIGVVGQIASIVGSIIGGYVSSYFR